MKSELEKDGRERALECLRTFVSERIAGAAGLDVVLSKCRYRATREGEVLLNEGEDCRDVYFVVRGCLQVFVYDESFNEMTRDLVTEYGWCSELRSFGTGVPATESIRAVEAGEVLSVERADFRSLMETVPAFREVYRQILEKSFTESTRRLNTMAAMTARSRIGWLEEARPDLAGRLSDRVLASYLGISAETYCRLKRKPRLD